MKRTTKMPPKVRFELRLDDLLVEIIDEERKKTIPPRSRSKHVEAVLMEICGAEYKREVKKRLKRLEDEMRLESRMRCDSN